jgi:endonuclease-3
MNKKQRAEEVVRLLKEEHPNPQTELDHKNEVELIVAVMLSAQTTDVKVNEVTKKLFDKYKTWEDYANAKEEDLQDIIRQVNYYKTKAKRLKKAGQFILDEFGGEIPREIKKLTKIPGIARKSANVILQELWDIGQGIVVDTHVTRVSNRLELTNHKDAVKIEKDLMKLFPKDSWRQMSGALVLHGRYVCKARNPKCEKCILNEICPSAFTF